jgi:hypothetical protein
MSVHQVNVEDAATGDFVAAQLEDALPASALFDIEDEWGQSRRRIRSALRSARVPPMLWPQSLHWNWAGKSHLILQRPRQEDYRLFGLSVGSAFQGAMLTLLNDKAGKLDPAIGQPIVYVDFLEVAPWNWTVPSIGQGQRFRNFDITIAAT